MAVDSDQHQRLFFVLIKKSTKVSLNGPMWHMSPEVESNELHLLALL